MKVYICENLNGVWIGAQAVIVAETNRKAKNALVRKLKCIGLWYNKNDKNDFELQEIDTDKAQIIMINDGDY